MAAPTEAATDSIVLEEEIDPNYVPTEEEVVAYAKWLGMDLDNDQDLFWIAREGLMAPLPQEWKPCKTKDTGDVYYFNFESGESTWDHPCDDYYKELYEEEKKKKEVALKEKNDQKRTKAKQDVDQLLGKSEKKKKKGLSELTSLPSPGMSTAGSVAALPSPSLRGTPSAGSLASNNSLGSLNGGAGLGPVSLRKAPLPDIKEVQKSREPSPLQPVSRGATPSPSVSPGKESSRDRHREREPSSSSGMSGLKAKVTSSIAEAKVDAEEDQVQEFNDFDEEDDDSDRKRSSQRTSSSSRRSPEPRESKSSSTSQPVLSPSDRSSKSRSTSSSSEATQLQKKQDKDIKRLEELHAERLERMRNQWDLEKKDLDEVISNKRKTLQRELENLGAELEDKKQALRSESAKYIRGVEDASELSEKMGIVEKDRDQWRSRCNDLEDKVSELERVVSKQKSELLNWKDDMARAEESFMRQLRDSKEKLQASVAEKDVGEAQLLAFKSKVRSLESQVADLESAQTVRVSAVSSASAEEANNTIDSLRNEEKRMRSEITELRAQLEATQEATKRAQRVEESLKRDVSALETLHNDKLSRKDKALAEAREELETVNTTAAERKRRIDDLTNKMATIESEKDTLVVQLKQAKSAVATVAAVEAPSQIADLNRQLQDSEQTISIMKTDERKLRIELTQLRDQLDAATEAARRFQRVEESLKRDVSTLETLHNDKLARKDKALAEVNEELENARSATTSVKKEKDVLSHENLKLHEQVKVLEQLCRSAQLAQRSEEDTSKALIDTRAELQALKRKHEELRDDSSRLQHSLETKTERIESLERELQNAKRAAIQVAGSTSGDSVHLETIADLEKQREELRLKNRQLLTDLTSSKEGIEEREHKCRILEQKQRNWAEEAEDYERRLQANKLRISELQNHADAQEVELNSIRSKIRLLGDEKKACDETILKLESKIRELREEASRSIPETAAKTSSHAAEIITLQESNEALKRKITDLTSEQLSRVTYIAELEHKIGTLVAVEHERDEMLRSSAKEKGSEDRQAMLLLSQVQAANEKAEAEKIKVVKAEIEIEQLTLTSKRLQARVLELETIQASMSASSKSTANEEIQRLVKLNSDLQVQIERYLANEARLSQELTASTKALVSAESNARQHATNAERTQGEVKELRVRCDYLEEQYQIAKSNSTTSDGASIKKHSEKLQDTISELRNEVVSITGERDSLHRRVQELERELQSLSTRLSIQSQETDRLHADALVKVGSMRDLELQIQKLKGDVIAANSVTEMKAQEVQQSQAMLTREREEKARLVAELDSANAASAELRQQLQQLRVRINSTPGADDQGAVKSAAVSTNQDIHRLSEAVITQQSAVLRLEEKVRDAEAVIHTLRNSASGLPPGASATTSRSNSLGPSADPQYFLEDEEMDFIPLKKSSSADLLDRPASRREMRRSNSQERASLHASDNGIGANVLSSLLKTIWKQFEGLAKEISPQQNSTTTDPAYAQNIQIWERRLKKEIAQVESSKRALREEKENLRVLQDRLAQRRDQWKSQARQLRPDDVRGKQALKAMCKTLNDEAVRMNRVIRQCQQSHSWLNGRMKKLEKLSKNIKEFKAYIAAQGSSQSSPAFSDHSELWDEFDVLGRELENDLTLLDNIVADDQSDSSQPLSTDEMDYGNGRNADFRPLNNYESDPVRLSEDPYQRHRPVPRPTSRGRAHSTEPHEPLVRQQPTVDRRDHRDDSRGRERERYSRDSVKQYPAARRSVPDAVYNNLVSPRRSRSPQDRDQNGYDQFPQQNRGHRSSRQFADEDGDYLHPLDYYALPATSLESQYDYPPSPREESEYDLHSRSRQPQRRSHSNSDRYRYNDQERSQSQPFGSRMPAEVPAGNSRIGVSSSTSALYGSTSRGSTSRQSGLDPARRSLDLDAAASKQARVVRQDLSTAASLQLQKKDAYDSHASFLNDLRKEIDKFSHAVPASSGASSTLGRL